MRTSRLLAILLALAAPGCRPAADERSPAPTVAAEPSWSEQLADVRAGHSRQIIVTREPVTPAQLQELAVDCANLEVLDLESFESPAADLAILAELPHLQRIRLGAPINDAGIEQLVTAPELIAVNLPAATFTDRGLETLAKLPKLELLRFRSPNVTDDGLRHIAAMPSLRFLHLIDVPVTDAGIAHLHSLTQLESLYLDGSRCTDAGLRDLLQAITGLHFHRDQLHLPGDPQADDHGGDSPSAATHP